MTELAAIETSIAERHFLKPPFYRAWTEGTLPRGALIDYAKQYYATGGDGASAWARRALDAWSAFFDGIS